ncbi:lipid II flippase MurJ, partial [Escherichia coli]|nr:lipid II flippase MurJ [Escherichia coli]
SGLLKIELAVVMVAGMLAEPWVIMVNAPGFAENDVKFALNSQLLKIKFSYILMIFLGSRVGAILNTFVSYTHLTLPTICSVL